MQPLNCLVLLLATANFEVTVDGKAVDNLAILDLFGIDQWVVSLLRLLFDGERLLASLFVKVTQSDSRINKCLVSHVKRRRDALT